VVASIQYLTAPERVEELVSETVEAARAASYRLAAAGRREKDHALTLAAAGLRGRQKELLAANGEDLEAGRASGLSPALLDRLALDGRRVEGIAAALEQIAALPDPVGEVIEGRNLANGLQLRKVRVPLGVIGVVYEARPNVTADAAALCLKAGNAVVLRGSSSAQRSNAVIGEIIREALSEAGLPAQAVQQLPGQDRDEIVALAQAKIDLIIPRGGEQLKETLQKAATVPVIYAASGNCHVYVDAAADLEMARKIAFNAKVQRPGVCNAAETLLVHEQVAEAFLPAALGELIAAGVEVRGDGRVQEIANNAGLTVGAASEEDFATEYLDLKLAVAVVPSVQAAIDHINRFGSGHSEAIVTADLAAARAFQWGVDAACVYVNASTRFTDGGEFGMGAEIGNSTQKLHARGPLGLRELTTYRYLIEGQGQVRS
jgi:glutamate-5-semialdehyde dehydrogenase